MPGFMMCGNYNLSCFLLHHCRGDRGVCPRFPDEMPNTDDVSHAAAGCGDDVIPVPDLPHLPYGGEGFNPDQ